MKTCICNCPKGAHTLRNADSPDACRACGGCWGYTEDPKGRDLPDPVTRTAYRLERYEDRVLHPASGTWVEDNQAAGYVFLESDLPLLRELMDNPKGVFYWQERRIMAVTTTEAVFYTSL